MAPLYSPTSLSFDQTRSWKNPYQSRPLDPVPKNKLPTSQPTASLRTASTLLPPSILAQNQVISLLPDAQLRHLPSVKMEMLFAAKLPDSSPWILQPTRSGNASLHFENTLVVPLAQYARREARLNLQKFAMAPVKIDKFKDLRRKEGLSAGLHADQAEDPSPTAQAVMASSTLRSEQSTATPNSSRKSPMSSNSFHTSDGKGARLSHASVADSASYVSALDREELISWDLGSQLHRSQDSAGYITALETEELDSSDLGSQSYRSNDSVFDPPSHAGTSDTEGGAAFVPKEGKLTPNQAERQVKSRRGLVIPPFDSQKWDQVVDKQGKYHEEPILFSPMSDRVSFKDSPIPDHGMAVAGEAKSSRHALRQGSSSSTPLADASNSAGSFAPDREHREQSLASNLAPSTADSSNASVDKQRKLLGTGSLALKKANIHVEGFFKEQAASSKTVKARSRTAK